MTIKNDLSIRYPGLFRRLFAIFYDCFLLIAILFVISAIAMGLNHGKAIDQDNIYFPLYFSVIMGACYLYFSWFWINGGQTLGMKTWQIKILANNDANISWKTTTIRFITAIFSWGALSLGLLWALVDRKHRCWHDISSGTYLVDLRDKT